jgi:hypothetical protein
MSIVNEKREAQHSRASREIGDTGERHQHYSQSQKVARLPIRFQSPKKRDRRIMVPKELVARADNGKKHSDDLRRELAILWNTYAKYGEFSVSMKMLEELYSSEFRKKLKSILDDVASPVRNHANFVGNSRCKSYKFKIPRPKKPPTYSGMPTDSSSQEARRGGPPTKLIRVTIPAMWDWVRYERWSAICVKNDWISNLDLDGRTDYGRQTFAALESATVPAVPETKRLTKHGVLKMAVRRHGRCYDPTSNLRKDLRRDTYFDGEPTVEIDIHAMYTCLLVSKLPNGPAKDRAIAALQDDWYKQFQPAYTQWFDSQLASGRGYILDGKWMIRLDDDPANDDAASIKVEYQRQCLFWQDRREASNPLRVPLRQLHPELCELIERWRNKLSPRELSHVLTKGEGSMIVDDTLSELERAGIVAKPIHDGVMVKMSRKKEAREIMLGVCEWHLGFEPRVSIKASESIMAAM